MSSDEDITLYEDRIFTSSSQQNNEGDPNFIKIYDILGNFHQSFVKYIPEFPGFLSNI